VACVGAGWLCPGTPGATLPSSRPPLGPPWRRCPRERRARPAPRPQLCHSPSARRAAGRVSPAGVPRGGRTPGEPKVGGQDVGDTDGPGAGGGPGGGLGATTRDDGLAVWHDGLAPRWLVRASPAARARAAAPSHPAPQRAWAAIETPLGPVPAQRCETPAAAHAALTARATVWREPQRAGGALSAHQRSACTGRPPPTARPTWRWVFQLLEGMHRVRVLVHGQAHDLREGRNAVQSTSRRLCGDAVCRREQRSPG
jgi:hypothetical protein